MGAVRRTESSGRTARARTTKKWPGLWSSSMCACSMLSAEVGAERRRRRCEDPEGLIAEWGVRNNMHKAMEVMFCGDPGRCSVPDSARCAPARLRTLGPASGHLHRRAGPHRDLGPVERVSSTSSRRDGPAAGSAYPATRSQRTSTPPPGK
ncbi:hypothetical protein PsYK624_044210 [Phanerochaete sordida]|uniref:Uncharacterized protein n=1 Tax=Phanerochaete sordida TaxID=48140 RepID=A0A9P3G3C6_9APHY|nr:hypothetical protein PsYK624_044210 [Phanerochaete sordida]